MNEFNRRMIRGYELRERVGSGGFGVVYRAYQPTIGRDVAIKIILPEHANQPEFVRHFEVEAQTIAHLEHPHIVPLYDFWRDPEGAYLVMRWLPNSLHSVLERGPWSLEATARLLGQLASALSLAHREGVIHRDIKPDNILLDEDDNAYLADFGIAKDMNVGDSSEDSASVGPFVPLTPEQIKGEPMTPRSDIYSLGLVIYEMLINQKPYPEATTFEQQKICHLTTPLPLVRGKRANLPAAIDEVLQTATAKNPDHRYADVGRFDAAFRAALPVLRRTVKQPLAEPLRERELEILQLMVDELTNDEIAERLVLSPSTVKWYIRQIYSKLDVHSRHQAIERAKQLHLVNDQTLIPEEETEPYPDPSQDERMPPEAELSNPYKGLRAFEKTDASLFFGRASLTERLLSRLADGDDGARFLTVVGPSGSGKSSVVKAGLIPALRKGALPNSQHWFITEMLPGAHPLEELEAALLRVSINPLPGILDQLSQDRRGLIRAVKRTLPSDPDVELVLVIDQFEELFTLVSDEAVRAHFIDNLLSAVSDPRGRVRVVLTLRADFYDRPLLYPRLAELVRSHTEVIVPLTASELERVIVGPAEQVGLMFEAGLVATMLKDVGEQPGTLPLLEYALSELYERRQDRLLTLAAYHAFGGISGALASRADALFDSLDAAGQQAARQMFLRLITLGEGIEDTRRRVQQMELASLSDSHDSMDDVIEVFSQFRLLTLDRDPLTRGPTVEIAHEALIREWARLRDWLRANREALRIQRRLMVSASEWSQNARDAGFLAGGARLTQFEALAAEGEIELTQEEHDYIRASVSAGEQQEEAERLRRERELQLARQAAQSAEEAAVSAQNAAQLAQRAAKSQRQSANRLRTLVGFLVLFLVVAAGLSIFAFNSRADAVSKGQLANEDAATSEANFMRAEAQRLAADSNDLQLRGENSELAALLALRSMNLQYTPQGDEALTDAFFLDLPTRVLRGAHQTESEVAYSPDGKTLVTTDDDNTAALWNLATGQQIRTFSGHTNIVYAVRFSPDGTKIVTGSFDHTVRLWDVATGKQIHEFVGHTDSVESVAFSPDGKTIASGGDDKTARLWDVATGKQIREFEGNTDKVAAVAFSPDGKTLITGGGDKTVRLWDVATGKQLRQFEAGGAVYSLGVSHDGKLIVTGTDDLIVRVWDLQSGQVLHQLSGHTNNLRVTVFSPDDKTILSASDDATARLWDVASGQELRRLSGHIGFVWGAAFAPDGNSVATVGDGVVKLWSLQRKPNLFQFAPQTSYILVALISPDGKSILTGSQDGTVHLWDLQTGQQIREFDNPGQPVLALAFSPDSKLILVDQLTSTTTVTLWDAQTGQKLHQLTSDANAQEQNVAFSPDGRYALIGDGVGFVHLMDVQTWQEVRRFVGHFRAIFAVAYAPDGKTVFTGTYDGTARLWDVASGHQLKSFSIADTGGNSTAYSPDGKLLAAGTWNGSIYVWDFATGKQLQRLVGHTGQVMVSFTPDGKYLMSAGYDGTIRIWDVTTWQEIRRLVTVSLGIGALSPDSQSVLDVTGSNSAELVPIDYHVIMQNLCSRLTRDLTDDERSAYDITDNSPTCLPKGAQSSVNAGTASVTPYPTPTMPIWTPVAPIALRTLSSG